MTVQRGILVVLLLLLVVPSALLAAHQLDPAYLASSGLYSSDFLAAYWRIFAVSTILAANTGAGAHAAFSRVLAWRIRAIWAILILFLLPLMAALAYCTWRLWLQSAVSGQSSPSHGG